jgi:ferrous iron transport protein B
MSAAAASYAPASSSRVALLGAPNCGKTTLFNVLTGGRAKVANYAGVTVERREGPLRGSPTPVQILDLPGTYSLDSETPDEVVVERALHGRFPGEAAPDALAVVVDATCLRRGLGLVAQALGLDRPTLVVLTMIDEVAARGGHIDVDALSRILGVRVLGVVGNRGVGVRELAEALRTPESWPRPALLPEHASAEERYAWVDAVIERVERSRLAADRRTDRIDAVLLHPVWGTLVFATVMTLLFQSIFAWAVPAMDAIDAAIGAFGALLTDVLPAGLLTDLLVDGVVAGVGSVLVFLPQIVILFSILHLLEDVGYMARAAFLVDRVMGFVGLQGRCFVSLLSSYACAIPGILAARTIASPRDRLATILVAPFMTCSARLPVYTLLIAAFVPARDVLGPIGLQGLVLLGLYLLGAFTALASAALLNSTLLRGTPSTFYMELPPYRRPTLALLASQIGGSALAFLKRAGTLILAASLLVWALLAFPRAPEQASARSEAQPSVERTAALDEAQQGRAQIEQSFAGRIGHALEPAIAPLGYDWRIGIGLVSSLVAREVIVSTLGQIYAVSDAEDFAGLRTALVEDIDPRTGARSFGLPSALSLLVFFVFALQCSSTIVLMARETGSWKWPALAFGYMLGLAYGASFLTYRIASALV